MTDMPPIKDRLAFQDRTMLYHLQLGQFDLHVPVRILGFREAYGNVRCEIEPVDGRGRAIVNFDKLSEPEPAASPKPLPPPPPPNPRIGDRQ